MLLLFDLKAELLRCLCLCASESLFARICLCVCCSEHGLLRFQNVALLAMTVAIAWFKMFIFIFVVFTS